MEDLLKKILSGIEELRTDVAGVKADIATVTTDVAGVKADLASVKTDVAGVKADVTGVKSEVAELKSELAELKTEVSEVKQAVIRIEANHGDKLAALFDDREVVKNHLEQIRETQERHSDKLDAIGLRMIETRCSYLAFKKD